MARILSYLYKWMKKQWSVVLIDQSPAQRRRLDIKRLRPLTEVFVIHDTSAFVEHIYRLEKLFHHLNIHMFIHDILAQTIVSDTIDVEAWFTLLEGNHTVTYELTLIKMHVSLFEFLFVYEKLFIYNIRLNAFQL